MKETSHRKIRLHCIIPLIQNSRKDKSRVTGNRLGVVRGKEGIDCNGSVLEVVEMLSIMTLVIVA